MATRVIFHNVIEDEFKFGSDETCSVSRVFFDLEEDGEFYRGLYVDVHEPADGSHQTDEITVAKPQGAPASLDLKSFGRAVCVYYQRLVNSAGYGKHLAKDKGFRTHGNELGLEQAVEL